MIINKKFSNAINNIPQKTPPIWFMRQAGRYHSHYQRLRKKHSFVTLCKTPELAAEVALGPINDFDYDVAILFSDILFPLESFGLKLDYNPGPVFENYFQKNMVNEYSASKKFLDELSFQAEALNITRNELPSDKSLVGFVGGPWTLFSYGAGLRNDEAVSTKEENIFFEKMIYDVLVPSLRSIIEMQLANNAEIVYMFDTNAKQLGPKYFIERYMPKLKRNIFDYYPKKIAYFSKNNPLIDDPSNIVKNNLAGMVYNKSNDMSKCLSKNQDGFLQGNFSPESLIKSEDDFKKDLDIFINNINRLNINQRSGWICSLNHGVLPKAKEENVKFFIDKIRSVFNQ